MTRFFAGWAFIITLLGFASRGAALIRNGRLKPKSTLQTAIGIKHPRITQKAMGFMGGSFNTREFFQGNADGELRLIKWTFLLAAFVVPLALLAAGWFGAPAPILLLAFVVQYLQRWFFFAQAKHPQNFYYQAIA